MKVTQKKVCIVDVYNVHKLKPHCIYIFLVLSLQYIQVCLDQQLLTAEYGGEILVSLQSAEMQYNIQSNLVPCSIFWTREVQEHFVGEDMEVNIKTRAFSMNITCNITETLLFFSSSKNGRGAVLYCRIMCKH